MVFLVYGIRSHVAGEGSFAAGKIPAAILPSARCDGVPTNRAEAGLFTTVGVSNDLAAGDQLRLMDWASAKWGV
jgi:hypothetical protein